MKNKLILSVLILLFGVLSSSMFYYTIQIACLSETWLDIAYVVFPTTVMVTGLAWSCALTYETFKN